MSALFAYIYKIYSARYFWLHLAIADVRSKYRRSTLGLIWSFIQPLAMTMLLAFVMSHIFHLSMKDYGPFVFSGIILWEFIIAAAVTGSIAFVQAEGYIKQYNHPLLIYPLRNNITALINSLVAFSGLVLWVLIWRPSNFGQSWLALFPAFFLLLVLGWSLATITAFIGTRFRDLPQLIIILMQAVWYVSPVFFQPRLYQDAGMGFLVSDNPIYHLLQLFRAPLLEGQWPEWVNYSVVFITAGTLWACALFLTYRQERKLIYYL